jgi:hypothetical protein
MARQRVLERVRDARSRSRRPPTQEPTSQLLGRAAVVCSSYEAADGPHDHPNHQSQQRGRPHPAEPLVHRGAEPDEERTSGAPGRCRPVEAATRSLPVLPPRLITHAGQPRHHSPGGWANLLVVLLTPTTLRSPDGSQRLGGPPPLAHSSSRPEGAAIPSRAQRCEVSQRVTRYWPAASPQADSDHDVTDVDPVQPLLIVSSAPNGVID